MPFMELYPRDISKSHHCHCYYYYPYHPTSYSRMNFNIDHSESPRKKKTTTEANHNPLHKVCLSLLYLLLAWSFVSSICCPYSFLVIMHSYYHRVYPPLVSDKPRSELNPRGGGKYHPGDTVQQQTALTAQPPRDPLRFLPATTIVFRALGTKRW